ncbi:inorganic phosphate transporter [Azotobacter chroococcum]|jgi:PiT family inorganic phosphate transporter|uniref:Phosphate transporter family protein n=1 Tax=Azotobacter chroococcum TaxID=353 RepID=A0A4R1PQA4_9GAMM|nr:inorganic phosphate transporter [Azotobacter chroococcum]TCL32657.1 phosphate transporter family protein [Azotobacter chroococcum]
MITFGVALIVGLWFIGKEVIQTVGTNLTEIHPASGFTAELAAAAVVMLASLLGLPVSSTHILIGAVLGIGLVNRQNNWDLMKPIAHAWVITLPAAAILSAIAFVVLRSVFRSTRQSMEQARRARHGSPFPSAQAAIARHTGRISHDR